MVYEYKKQERKQLLALTKNWQETLIWSCVQGFQGETWADEKPENETNADFKIKPESAQFLVADFCFFAGKANKELVMNHPSTHPGDFIIMVPQTEDWSRMIEECYGDKCKKVVRYAFDKNPDVFDLSKLKEMASGLENGCITELIDQNFYNQAKSNGWSYDLCSQFATYEDFKRNGLGVVVTKDGEVVAGASSYGVYKDGIEIEVDTREDCRQRGYARAASARLILECLKRGKYPSWDAQNLKSVGLAKQLGYQFSHEYTAYEVCW